MWRKRSALVFAGTSSVTSDRCSGGAPTGLWSALPAPSAAAVGSCLAEAVGCRFRSRDSQVGWVSRMSRYWRGYRARRSRRFPRTARYRTAMFVAETARMGASASEGQRRAAGRLRRC